MNFGEKLFKLRKEKGLSQEALAGQLGTTRQAVSKWENNQGFPETEKLLQLSNIFEVSTDFLLKEEKSVKASDERGYYVSMELARGYLANVKKINKCLGLCFLFWALAGIPYVVFPSDSIWRLLGMGLCVVIGISIIISGLFMEQEKYKILEREPLIFDYECLKELSEEYKIIERRCRLVAVPCMVLFVVGILAIVLTMRGVIDWSEYHSLVFLGFAVGIMGFVQSAGTLEAYELLVKNEQYCGRYWFKIKRRIRKWFDKI